MKCLPGASRPVRSTSLLCVLLLGLNGLGCTAIQEIAALRQVDFSLDQVTEARLAGIDLDGLNDYSSVNPLDLVRIGNAIRNQSLPFAFTVHIGGRNPDENEVSARLVQMDWTLFLEDRETISGVFNDEVVLPPGRHVDIPISMELDLYRFFESNARDLIELALSVAGAGGSPKNIRISAVPTIQTALGPIRYPGRIDIVSATVGS